MELNSNRIYVRSKEDVSKYVGYSEPKIVSDSSAPLLARQLALHANVSFNFSVSRKNYVFDRTFITVSLARVTVIEDEKSKSIRVELAGAIA